MISLPQKTGGHFIDAESSNYPEGCNKGKFAADTLNRHVACIVLLLLARAIWRKIRRNLEVPNITLSIVLP